MRSLKRALLAIPAIMMAMGGWMIAASAPAEAVPCEEMLEVEHHLRLSNTGGPSDICLPDFLNGDHLLWCDNNFDGDDPVWYDSTTAFGIDYNTGTVFNYGRPGDVPVCGDWDGDGRDGIGVVRGATWFLRNTISGGAANLQFPYGRVGDFPLAGDWNGDGRDTPGVVRDATWLLRNSNSGGAANLQFPYGRVDELFRASADFLAQGIDTPIITRSLVASGAAADSDTARAPDWSRTPKQ
jgi:hypothetical protein